jgi:hypothetical protein
VSKLFLIAFASLALQACGNGNETPAVTSYGYGQNGYGYNQNGLCPPSVARDWNNFVAAPCNQSQEFGGACARGVEFFIQRDQAFLQGPGCTLVTNQLRWCPGDMNGAQTFQVNIPVLQSILTQRGGPGSFPVGGGGGFRPR